MLIANALLRTFYNVSAWLLFMEYRLRDNSQLSMVKSPSFQLQHCALDWSNDYLGKKASDRTLLEGSCKKYIFQARRSRLMICVMSLGQI